MDDGDGESPESATYEDRKDDPEYLLTLVDKFVQVQLIKETAFKGFVYTVDPVTHSVILLIPNEDTYKTMIIPGHAVVNITCLSAPNDIQAPTRQPIIESNNSEEILAKKNKLLSWLKLNLLPVSEDGENIVVGSANILPPYGTMDIYAENSLIATQIRRLMNNMPN